MKTYSISLKFDFASSSSISSLVEKFSCISGNDFLSGNKVPLHLTLGFFHCPDEDFEKLKKLFYLFLQDLHFPSEIEISGIDTFKNKVIFLAFSENSLPSLISLNKKLNEIFLPHFEPGANRNYLSENWLPHIALAVKLSPLQFEKAFSALKFSLKEEFLAIKSLKVSEISLSLCKPYLEVENFSLS